MNHSLGYKLKKNSLVRYTETMNTQVHNPVDTVNVAEYPMLQEILWDNHAKQITEDDAFYYYETRYAYVRPECMDQKEKQFLNRLIQQCGNGVLLAS